jgi:hypothetical protein
MPIGERVVAYGTVVHRPGGMDIKGKYCRRGFNVEVHKQGREYVLDFDTVPASPRPPLNAAPVVLATARSSAVPEGPGRLCYAQVGRVQQDQAIIRIIETPNNPHYTPPDIMDSSFDFVILADAADAELA